MLRDTCEWFLNTSVEVFARFKHSAIIAFSQMFNHLQGIRAAVTTEPPTFVNRNNFHWQLVLSIQLVTNNGNSIIPRFQRRNEFAYARRTKRNFNRPPVQFTVLLFLGNMCFITSFSWITFGKNTVWRRRTPETVKCAVIVAVLCMHTLMINVHIQCFRRWWGW